MTTTFSIGEHVRFTAGALGMIDPTQPGAGFMAETVGNGDTGDVVDAEVPDGWLAVEPDDYPGTYVPVHPGMIERA